MSTTITTNRKDSFIAQRDRTALRAKLMLDTLEREQRSFTPDEEKVYNALEAETESLSQKIERIDSDAGMNAAIDRLTGGQAFRPTDPAAARFDRRSLGAQFVNNQEFREFLKAGGHRRAGSWSSPTVELTDLRAATLSEDPASGGDLVAPDRQPGIVETYTRPIVIADLIAPGTTTSNAVQYMKETSFVNAAAAVAEGTAKPESTLVFDAVTDLVVKLAHWLPVTEELLEDVSSMQSYIDARLRFGLDLTEDDQLLNGSGVAPNMTGYLHRAGLGASLARTTETNADLILDQMFALWFATGHMATGLVMNPGNWKVILKAKNSQGDYLGTGPFARPQAAMLWGVPVAVTPAIVANTCLVGAFRTASQLFRRGGTRVEVSNSHSDFFTRNLLAVRAERRESLCVYRPGAFATCTNLE